MMRNERERGKWEEGGLERYRKYSYKKGV